MYILALNMEGMQKTIQETRDKVDELAQKDYNNYKDTKKLVKNNIISGVVGAVVTGVIGVVSFLISMIVKGG